MNEIIFTDEDFIYLRSRLLQSEIESFAILYTNIVQYHTKTRLLVTDIEIPPNDAYRKRNTTQAIIAPEYLVPIVKRAMKSGKGLVFTHTHPWDIGIPEFSKTDDLGEEQLRNFLINRELLGPHAALLFGKDYCKGRFLASKQDLKVLSLGNSLKVHFDPNELRDLETSYVRQVQLLGPYGQVRLSSLKVGIVGLGGTGSLIAEELAYVGVKNFLLIDPDTVEETNLNRLVGSNHEDIGRPKVDVIENNIKKINSNALVNAICDSVLNLRPANLLLECDIILCCTDSQASRATLNQISYQYLIPTIDIGVSISTSNENISRITGRVQLLSPGQACLTCQEILDPNIVRQEFMSPEEQKQDPYFLGAGEPQPAVISLNSTMSSLAVTMFLSIVSDFPSRPRHLIYDAILGRVRAATSSRNLTCVVCSKNGALAKGNEWPLPVHQPLS